MLENLRLVRDLLDRREQRRALLLIAMIIVGGFVEMVRVASIVPFVAVISDPSVLETNPYLATAYQWLGFESYGAFLFALGCVVFVIMLGSQAFAALTSYATVRFAAMRNHRLSRDLFKVYINRPYEWFLKQHGASLGKSVLSEVREVVGGALMPYLSLITGCVSVAFMVMLLLIAEPLLAVIVTLALSGGYALIYFVSRRNLTRLGKEQREANLQRFTISGEAFGGIKDIKLLGLEKSLVDRFEVPSRRFVTTKATADLIGSIPPNGLQVLAFGIVLLIVFYQLAVYDDVGKALPVIALYALAGSRLMPALQKVYLAVSKLQYAETHAGCAAPGSERTARAGQSCANARFGEAARAQESTRDQRRQLPVSRLGDACAARG